jgi:hypothetical protein
MVTNTYSLSGGIVDRAADFYPWAAGESLTGVSGLIIMGLWETGMNKLMRLSGPGW